MCSVHKVSHIISLNPANKCKPRNEVCQDYQISTNPLLRELRQVEQSGEVVVLPKVVRQGTPLAKKERASSVRNNLDVSCAGLNTRFTGTRIV